LHDWAWVVKALLLQSTWVSVPKVSTERTLNCTPPPHDLEQGENSDHEEYVQSATHGASTHGSASLRT